VGLFAFSAIFLEDVIPHKNERFNLKKIYTTDFEDVFGLKVSRRVESQIFLIFENMLGLECHIQVKLMKIH